MCIFTVSKEELCNILNVTNNTLNALIKRNTLEDRLYKVGYKLVRQYKIGRCNAYDIQQIQLSDWSKLQIKYNVKKENEHTIYTYVRLNNLKEPRTKLLKDNSIDISTTTAGRYDNILIEEKAMQEDQQVYYKTNKDGLWEEVTGHYYKAFWIECNEYKYIVSMYRNRLRKQEITQDTYDLVISNLYDTIERFKGYIIVKFKTYKEAENTKLVLDMIHNRKINIEAI